MDAGWRVTVDFSSQCKILWGEKGHLFMKKNRVKKQESAY